MKESDWRGRGQDNHAPNPEEETPEQGQQAEKELQKRKQQLEEAARDLEGFFDVTQGLLLISDPEGVILKLNKAWEDILGYSRSELIGKQFLDYVHPEDLEKTRQAIAQLGAGQKIAKFFNRYRHKDGSVRWLEWRASTREELIYGSANDVTDSLSLQQELAREKQFLQLVIDSSPNPIFAKDWYGRHTLANDMVARLFGTTKEEMIGSTDYDMTATEEEIASFLRDDREVMESGKVKHIPEEQLTDSQGRVRWFQTTKVPLILSENPEERQVMGIATDITRRKQIEERLQEQERLYRGLVESQQDLIVRVDSQNRFTYVNDAYCRVFGKSREELIGNTFAPLIHEEDIEPTMEAMKDLERPPFRAYMEQRALTKDGWRWLAWEDSAVLDDQGRILEIQGVGRDITDLKEAQRKAEASSRAKSEFLATMSHEIRTPMNSIVGMADLLAETELTPEQKEYVKHFRRAGETLLNLINDILDISKIEAGHLQLEESPFNLEEVLEKTAAFMSFRANEKGLNLLWRIQPGTPLNLSGDANRLQQVLVNLLGNAIKFTDEGQVTLTVERVPREALQNGASQQKVHACSGTQESDLCLAFTISDTGIGIAEQDREHIFESFTQGDSSTTRKYGGSGLGLHISKRLVEMMGGAIEVQSTPGRGSTFTFTVGFKLSPNTSGTKQSITGPAAEQKEQDLSAEKSSAEKEPAAKNIPPAAGQPNILLVEDNEDNQRLIQAYLKKMPYQVFLAVNGAEALEKVKGQHFDLVLMDIQMPEMDGYQATREIRRREQATGRDPLPIIALTAYALKEEVQKAFQAGCTAHLSKPVKKDTLLNTLQQYLQSW